MQKVLASIIEALPITLTWNSNLPIDLGEYDPNEFKPLEKIAEVRFRGGAKLVVNVTDDPQFFSFNKHEMAQYLASRICGTV